MRILIKKGSSDKLSMAEMDDPTLTNAQQQQIVAAAEAERIQY